jgi:membrane protein YdbS with pleckstrin-like domain
MLENNHSAIYSGVGFLELLSLLFIGLKLSKKIDWSWWAVLSPLWVPVAIVALIILVLFIFYVIAETASIVQYKIWKK